MNLEAILGAYDSNCALQPVDGQLDVLLILLRIEFGSDVASGNSSWTLDWFGFRMSPGAVVVARAGQS